MQRGHRLDAEDRVLRRHVLRLVTRYATDWRAPADQTPFLDEVMERLAGAAADGLVVLADRSVSVTPVGRAFLRYLCLAFDARLQRRSQAVPALTSPQ